MRRESNVLPLGEHIANWISCRPRGFWFLIFAYFVSRRYEFVTIINERMSQRNETKWDGEKEEGKYVWLLILNFIFFPFIRSFPISGAADSLWKCGWWKCNERRLNAPLYLYPLYSWIVVFFVFWNKNRLKNWSCKQKTNGTGICVNNKLVARFEFDLKLRRTFVVEHSSFGIR